MGAKSKEHPLLRTLVVCGASLVGLGCGARTESSGNAEGGSSAASGQGGVASGVATVRCPEQCSSPAQYVCDELATGTSCHCDLDAPLRPDACETKWDFTCESVWPNAACEPFIALGPSFACTCSAQRLRPEDCQWTAQFSCSVFQPVAQGCHCDPSAPTGPADCVGRDAYRCYARNPDVGCRCEELTPIK